MKAQKDRHLDTPGEVNRDKHINFLAVEEGDEDASNVDESNNADEVDNGFFTSDDEPEKSQQQNHGKLVQSEKVKSVVPDAVQSMNDSVPEGDNNNTSGNTNNNSMHNDDEAH